MQKIGRVAEERTRLQKRGRACRREDELAEERTSLQKRGRACSVFHTWVTSMPSTYFDDCCLWEKTIFSIVTNSHTVTVSHRLQQCAPSTVVTVYIPCCVVSSSNITIMDIYVRKPNSTRISGTDVFVDDALSAKDAQYFRSPCRIIQISSYRKYIQVPLSQ